MQQKKRKQHYVWKEHLKSWSNTKDRIYTLIIETKNIANPNLIGVAQERFYYELDEFTLEEEVILEELIKSWSTPETMEINLHYLECFTSYSKIKREISNKILIPEIKEKINLHLDILKCNGMENIHSNYENYGDKIIKIKTFEELNFLLNENNLFLTILFLSLQYTRTKKMKKSIEDRFRNHDYFLPKYWNIFSFVLASGITTSLVFFEKLSFIYYENKTDIDFVISDQPIINILKEEKDEKGNVKKLKYYYPINPKVALVIHYDQQENKFEKVIIDKELVFTFNRLICENAESFIFSTSEEQLREIKNCL